jgi:hypothetical protein
MLYTIGVITISLDIFLLLIWGYNMFLRPNGTDPAGSGIALGLLLACALYFAGAILLIRTEKNGLMVLALGMAVMPMLLLGNMILKERRRKASL